MELQVTSKGVSFDDLDEFVNRNDICLASRKSPKPNEEIQKEEGKKQFDFIMAIPGAKIVEAPK